MTAEAAEIRVVDENSLQVGQELQGGDIISAPYYCTLSINVDGVAVGSEWGNGTGRVQYQLPVGKNYRVTDYRYTRENSLQTNCIVCLKTCIDASDMPPTNNIKEDDTEDDTAENQNQAASYYQSDAHVHTFSWVTVQEAGAGQDGLEEYRCSCGLVESRNTIPGSQAAVSQFKDMIESAPAGEKISFDTGRLYTLSDSIIKKLAERNDVSAEITFEYQGKNYKMTIPAGADYTAILGDEENFYGYFYFAQLIGAVIEEI